MLSFAQSSSKASLRVKDLMVACRAQHDLASVKPLMSSYYSPHSSFNFSLPVIFAFAERVVETFLRASALVLPLFAALFSDICLSFSLMSFRFLLSCHLLSQAFPDPLLKLARGEKL